MLQSLIIIIIKLLLYPLLISVSYNQKYSLKMKVMQKNDHGKQNMTLSKQLSFNSSLIICMYTYIYTYIYIMYYSLSKWMRFVGGSEGITLTTFVNQTKTASRTSQSEYIHAQCSV